MSVTLTFKHTVVGTLTDVTSVVLSDPTASYGVKRDDTDAVVVVDATPFVKQSTGYYTYSFTEPEKELTYTYFVEWVYGGNTFRKEFTYSDVSTGITKSDILSFANSRLNRADTDIDDSIKLVLRDLATLRVIKSQDVSQSVTSSSSYLTYPTDALDGESSIISVVLTDSSGNIGEPLTAIAAGWQEYKLRMENFTSSARSEPYQMITHNRRIYLWPAPNGDYDASIWYYSRHDDTAETISFSDDWINAIYFGACMEVAIHHKMEDQIKLWSGRYYEEKERQRMAHTGG